jgi:hypothetical protein
VPRGATSRADQQLIAALKTRRLTVSPYQLERWRRIGLVPPNTRRSLGRGRGTTSQLAPDAIACAATIARANDPKPSSIFWSCILAVAGYYRDTSDVAARPLRLSLNALIHEFDLLDIDEDTAYEDAAFASLPQFCGFSPQRQHPSLRDVPNVVDHKRHVHEHYLVASYLGVSTVGQQLLRQTVLELGFANDDEADALMAFLNTNFTPAEERVAILNQVDMPHLTYLIGAAHTIVNFTESHDRNPWPSATTEHRARELDALGLGFVRKLREPNLQLTLAVTIFLAAEQGLQSSVIHALGDEWSGETRSRIHRTSSGVQVAPLSPAKNAERERRWQLKFDRDRDKIMSLWRSSPSVDHGNQKTSETR